MRRAHGHQGFQPSMRAGGSGSYSGAVVAIFFGIVMGFLSWALLGRAGLTTVMTLLGGAVIGTVMSYIAWQRLVLLVGFWLFSMSGFRTYAMIYMPVLPDVSIDRILVMWIMVLFSMRLLMRRDSLASPFTIDVFVLLHTLYIFANAFYIGNKEYIHMWALSNVTPLLAFFVGKHILRRDRDTRAVFIVLFGACIYYFSQSIAQKYDLNFMIWPKAIIDRDTGMWPAGRSRGPFLHPPLFGQMMGMCMMVMFYFFYKVRLRLAKILILGAIGLNILGLLFTYTRAPWIAAIGGVFTLAILRPRYRQLLAGMGVILSVAAFVGALRFADDKLLEERVSNTHTIDNRLVAMSSCLRMWRDHPALGIGYFNWDDYYPLYRRGEEIPLYGYVERSAGLGVVIHDIYWGRLAEEGLISIVLLTVIVGLIALRWRYLWRRVSDDDWLSRDGLAVTASIFVVYMLGGLAIDYRYFDLVNAIPFLLGGMVCGYIMPEHGPPPPPYPNWTPPDFAKFRPKHSATADQE